VRKTELLRTQLGSAGQVIAHRLSDRVEREGITQVKSLAKDIDKAGDEDLQKTATAEMDDATEARRARQAKEIDDLRRCNRVHSLDERCARWLLMTHDRVKEDSFSLIHEFLAQRRVPRHRRARLAGDGFREFQ
jgi:hypothetical protein